VTGEAHPVNTDESHLIRLEYVEAERTRALRLEVLRAGMAYETTYYEGDDSDGALHVAATQGAGQSEEVISVGTVFPEAPPWDPDMQGAWRIRGMATKPKRRGQGLGRQVLDALVDHSVSSGGRMIWCHARVRAVEFYRRAGFAEVGEPFEDEIAPHQSMKRTLCD
jgi:predicted GNAT family N-acyltransferase